MIARCTSIASPSLETVCTIFFGGVRDVEIVHRAAIAQHTPAEVIDSGFEHALVQPAAVRIEAQPTMTRVHGVVGAARGAEKTHATSDQLAHRLGLSREDRSASGTARSRHEIRYFCGHCSGCLTFGSYTHDGRARCSSPRCARREGCLAALCCPHPPCSPDGLRAACLPQASGSAPCSHVLGRLSG